MDHSRIMSTTSLIRSKPSDTVAVPAANDYKPPNPDFASSHQVGIIAGATIGGLLVIILLTVIYVYFFRDSSLHKKLFIVPEITELPGSHLHPGELPVSTRIQWPQNAATRAVSRVRGDQWGGSRDHSRRRHLALGPKSMVELNAGECVEELGHSTPCLCSPHKSHKLGTLVSGGEATDYFSLLSPRISVSPRAIITPGAKEIPAAIIPKILHSQPVPERSGNNGSVRCFSTHEKRSPPPPVPNIGDDYLASSKPPIFIRRALSKAGFDISSPSESEVEEGAAWSEQTISRQTNGETTDGVEN
ncbi:uncharacterized protein KY384_005237 [Bacidia gigantensis]|uniref:uncharacterized protein n=1 Tax=Bacidia gigantensis TaxID=2732470 RepID=UPI001D0470FA|nr:uncharacterized protein KY384_005237 [Bacidia gigantensis]KAG8529756.1 hypothetical protein KY384_005237 [Bacidia gigantensis]